MICFSIHVTLTNKKLSLFTNIQLNLFVLLPTFKRRLQLIFIFIRNDRKETCVYIHIINTINFLSALEAVAAANDLDFR